MDYKGSIAQQDIGITTGVQVSAVVGDNFYKSMLYVTNRFSEFPEGVTPEYPIVTKNTYASVIGDYNYLSDSEKKIIMANLAMLFAYANVTVYIVPPASIAEMKYKAYFTYLDIEWNTAAAGGNSDYVLSAKGAELLTAVKNGGIDSDFTALFADVPVDPTKMKGTATASTAATVALLTAQSLDIAGFARPAAPPATEAGTTNAYLDASNALIADSAALYQLGRSLSFVNGSGVPVGNSFDMDAVAFANVVPTVANTSDLEGASEIMTLFFEDIHLNYFKPVGNGTGNITNYGGWTLMGNCIGAQWIVAYMNYMNRVACATIMTSGTALKNAATYGRLLAAIEATAANMRLSNRLTNFVLSAPDFGSLPTTDGHTITIPNAWSGVYVDNLRKVNIFGSISVAA